MHPRAVRRGAVVAVLVGAGAVAGGLSLRGADPAICDRLADDAARRAALVTGTGPDLLVVGDSWSVAPDLADPADSWPTRLPGRVHVAGFSGSGFSPGASGCDGVSFAAQAAEAEVRPRRVVVAGGLNDVDQSDEDIEAGVARLIEVLEGHEVVVVGPAAAPSRAAGAARVDALLARLADAAGWGYVSTYDWELDYLPDGLHLTPAGHREFGDRVAEAVGPAA
ncbi:SGNH/GDSL hydrolase family protein [Nocardioides coralli]|uniref:SGNH/GDSL hydrolase family protein n=1 Tax=Nocardioides coralli TaxID=2872154 RepID=UPI001CA40012|nr:SGNH/GDSL hydrolase family protein [Nocardioides coralli]QZY29661.1 SGNH/GDSL hydrolase family protein [Nocardioides coralli]